MFGVQSFGSAGSHTKHAITMVTEHTDMVTLQPSNSPTTTKQNPSFLTLAILGTIFLWHKHTSGHNHNIRL